LCALAAKADKYNRLHQKLAQFKRLMEMTSTEIRQKFLDFFALKGHHIVPSAPIVIKNDPTLLFTNAGMNQFKEYFLGNKPSPYKRVADTQKCLRVSGKHNDLEEVGVDTYHHTMFEMLGNWSFGDYFKTEAIEYSWELLTKIYNLPQDRLYATVFEGDEKENLPRSTVALKKWQEYLTVEHIVFGNKKDNFWEMGDTGPCGPCSEIHVDLRPDEEREKIPGHLLVNKDHPQVIEIWNNVFIQFNRLKDGTLEQLKSTHVDTGMGFERLVRVIQQKRSNYDTDIFSGTIKATEKITGKLYEGGDSKKDVAFRVIADHIRAIGFTIADGQLPSNTGAGYVIRRILRRAVRYYYSYLGYNEPLLHQLIAILADQFKSVFPELQQQSEFVTKVVKEEEEAFLRTLGKGLKRIDEQFTNAVPGSVMSGTGAFELYDTYGFPLDLTKLIAHERGLTVDEVEFNAEMQQQKNRSRAATQLDTEDWIWLDENAKGGSKFSGYSQLEDETTLIRYRKVKAKGKESFQIVLESTPFYAESGGQVGDKGWLSFDGERVTVVDTKKENDLIIHVVNELPAVISKDVKAWVDPAGRKATSIHHSATHLLHAALRKLLGTHVAQKGSLVNDSNLRFDFSHFAKMTPAEISEVESLVNEKIRQNIPVVIREMPKEEALALGAMALFGEKYGDMVRVVVIDPQYSVELCGGTHVGSTGELGYFKITAETAVAAGVRRVEAISGKAFENYFNQQLSVLDEVRMKFKNPADLAKAVDSLQEENASLKKQVEHFEARMLVGIRNEILQKDEIIDGVTFIGENVNVSNADSLKKICTDIKNNLHDYLVVLTANIGGKPFVAVAISDTVVQAKQLDAGHIIKTIVAPLIKGGGGGQKNLATAGGQDASQLTTVIEKIRSLISSNR
jgi:alanyl-tRNA synthetase